MRQEIYDESEFCAAGEAFTPRKVAPRNMNFSKYQDRKGSVLRPHKYGCIRTPIHRPSTKTRPTRNPEASGRGFRSLRHTARARLDAFRAITVFTPRSTWSCF